MPILTDEQIAGLKPEEKQKLITLIQQELTNRGGGQQQTPSLQTKPLSFGGHMQNIATGVGRGIGAGLKALPSVLLEGKVPETSDTSKALQELELKRKYSELYPTPSEKLSQMELMEIERKKREQIPSAPPVPVPTSPLGIQPIETPSGIPKVEEEAPPMYIEVPTGEYDKYTGIKKVKTEKNPAYERWEKKQEQAEKGLPAESAGKLVMLQQALSDLESVEKQLFTPEGKFLRGRATAANIPGGRLPLIPEVGFGTEARTMNSKINNALEAKLRIETGAAATPEEFKRLQARFGITGADTAESAKNKLSRLKDFMRNAIIVLDPTGKFTYKTGDRQLDTELNTPNNISQISTESEGILMEDANGNRALVNPNTGEIIKEL